MFCLDAFWVLALNLFTLGISKAAHPLHRSRWVMYMMKLRLISMKAKIGRPPSYPSNTCFTFLWCLLSVYVFLDVCKFRPMLWSTCCVILGWTDLSNSGGSATIDDKKECSWGGSENHTNNSLSPRNSLCLNDYLNNSLWKLWVYVHIYIYIISYNYVQSHIHRHMYSDFYRLLWLQNYVLINYHLFILGSAQPRHRMFPAVFHLVAVSWPDKTAVWPWGY